MKVLNTVDWVNDNNGWGVYFYLGFQKYFARSIRKYSIYKGRNTYIYYIYNMDGDMVGEGIYRVFSAVLSGIVDGFGSFSKKMRTSKVWK